MSTFILIRRLTALIMLAFIAQTPIASAAILSLQPDTYFVANGESLALDFIVSDLGNFGSDSLGAFDIDVDLDSSALSFRNYSLGSFLGDPGQSQALDVGTGDSGASVNLAEVSLLSAGEIDALQPSEFVLATLNFNVLDLDFGDTMQVSILRGPVLADGFGRAIDVSNGRSATVEGRDTRAWKTSSLSTTSDWIGTLYP